MPLHAAGHGTNDAAWIEYAKEVHLERQSFLPTNRNTLLLINAADWAAVEAHNGAGWPQAPYHDFVNAAGIHFPQVQLTVPRAIIGRVITTERSDAPAALGSGNPLDAYTVFADVRGGAVRDAIFIAKLDPEHPDANPAHPDEYIIAHYVG